MTQTAPSDAPPWLHRRAEQLLQWLHIDATTGREAAFLKRLESDLSDEGWRVSRHPVPPHEDRWNLLATGDQTPEVVFSTHVDTVPPFLPVRRDGDLLRGRGACDTKGVLITMVQTMALLRETHPHLAPRLGLMLVIGEEVDHCGAAAAAIDPAMPRPSRIILGEPTRGLVARGQKGILKVRLVSHGKAGHSAFEHAGHSAIHALLAALQRVMGAQWPDDPVLGPTTLNVGTIHGGVAANIFAPDAHAEIMVRAVSDPMDLLARFHDLCGDDAQVQLISHGPPQRFDAPPPNVDTTVVPFNSDAAWLSPLGPVWLAGPGDIQLAHSDDEHISLQDLQAGVQLYTQLALAAFADIDA